MSSNDIFDPVAIGTAEGAEDGVSVLMGKGPNGERRAAFLPRAMQKLGNDGVVMAADLQRTVLAMQQLQETLSRQVSEARDMGMSWNSIGWCVGTTGDAARQRWGLDHG